MIKDFIKHEQGTGVPSSKEIVHIIFVQTVCIVMFFIFLVGLGLIFLK